MHLVGIILGLVISFYLVALIIAVVEMLHAPIGYEDANGFHEVAPAPSRRHPERPSLPRINRHLPLGGLS